MTVNRSMRGGGVSQISMRRGDRVLIHPEETVQRVKSFVCFLPHSESTPLPSPSLPAASSAWAREGGERRQREQAILSLGSHGSWLRAAGPRALGAPWVPLLWLLVKKSGCPTVGLIKMSKRRGRRIPRWEDRAHDCGGAVAPEPRPPLPPPLPPPPRASRALRFSLRIAASLPSSPATYARSDGARSAPPRRSSVPR